MSRVDEAMRRASDAAPRRASEPQASPREPGDPDLPAGVDVVPVEIDGEADAASLVDDRLNPPRTDTISPLPGRLRTPDTDHVDAQPQDRETPLFRRFDFNLAEKLVVDRRILPVSREQYRRLAAILHDAQATRGLRVAMIASAVAGEGKSLTAANLALTLSESYRRRVLLIDADLRRPALHRAFKLDAASGLADGLDPNLPQGKLIVRQVLPNLAVLPAGSPINDPMARLISERMRQLVEEASKSFDWVIIDAPPLMLLPDAHVLASMVDTAVLVVKAGATPHHLVKRATDTIGKSKIIGVVLNRAEVLPGGTYDEDYAYYAKRKPAKAQ
jgi:capsular exopolysaccharide synthesis family protein